MRGCQGSVEAAFEGAPSLAWGIMVADGQAFDEEDAGHFHVVVVRMAGNEAEDVIGGGFPHFLEGLAGEGVEAAEGFVEEEDVSFVFADGELGHDEGGFAAVAGGEASVGFFDIEFDAFGEGEGVLELVAGEEGFENGAGGDLRIEAHVLGEVLEEAIAGEVAFEGFEGAGEGAEESGLATSVAGEEEMGAATEFDGFAEAGESFGVTDLQARAKLDGWCCGAHRVGILDSVSLRLLRLGGLTKAF